MSGGHFDYHQYTIKFHLERIAEDEDVLTRFPILTKLFEELGTTLCEVIGDLDYDLSGDRPIKNDQEFELDAWRRLINVPFVTIRKLIKEANQSTTPA